MAMIFLMCSYLLQFFSSPVGVPVVEKSLMERDGSFYFKLWAWQAKKTNELSNILFDSVLI
jgi:hypothetical protein